MPPPRVIAILGPTAGGKSDLAVGLCEQLDDATGCAGEIVGADSMQVYRRLDAGTAKPPPELRERVPHHLIDLVEPTQRFTVRDWLNHAEGTIADLQQRGKHPVVVGGTNLYLRALLEGLMEGPDHDPAFRATLEGVSAPQLHERLREIDPEAAGRIMPNDRQRLTRALEVFHLTSQPISALQQQWDDTPPDTYRFDPVLIGLRWDPDTINPRINLRVKAMFAPESVDPEIARAVCIRGESLPDEVRRLEAEGVLGPQAREALGYKQTLAAIGAADMQDPRIRSLDDAMERTKVLTRRFAKQQRTWLKRFVGVHWIDMPDEGAVERALDAVRATIRTSSR